MKSSPQIVNRILPALVMAAFAFMSVTPRPGHADPSTAGNAGTSITSVAEMFAGDDPLKDPLDIELLKEWDEDGIHFEQMYFTGQITDGVKTRVYAYRGAPIKGDNLPGMLHGHGGGGSASLEAVKFWAARGYVCVSYDYTGDQSKHGPQYKREHFTRWGEAIDKNLASALGLPAEKRDPRWTFWYNVTAAGRRAITLIQQHPRVDPDRIGAYGISAGGYLCWMVAGADSRLKTIAPVYGNAAGIYRDKEGRPLVIENEAAFEKKQFLLTPEAHELYAPNIHCSVLFMTATNDGFNLDHSFDTLDRIPAPIVRQLFTPRYVHHMEPAESERLPMWMAWQLKGEGMEWPATPKVTAEAGGEIPQLRVVAGKADQVEKVEIFYCIDNPWPASRFWRDGIDLRRDGEGWAARAPFVKAGEKLYAFANVTWKDGPKLSSRVIEVDTGSLTGVRPTLKPETLVDDMHDVGDWYWVPAYTEPLQYNSYFMSWKGPNGEPGFTLNTGYLKGSKEDNSFHFDIATQKLGDPQWQGKARKTLLMDYWGPNPPKELKIRPVAHWYRANSQEYFHTPTFEKGKEGWVTLRLDASLFKDKDGKAMPDWSEIQVLDLIGEAYWPAPPVFNNLRWDE